MKKIIILTLTFIAALQVAVSAQAKAGKIDTVKHARFYTCPMHDSIASKKPGNCPVCGMKLIISKKEEMKQQQAKNYSCPIHLDVVSDHPGKCPKCGKPLTGSIKEQMKAKVVKMYTCPMHPEVALESDGTCPKCGMKLTQKKN
jgi:predicted RNA-binding Zn-ribbon protein involved in translation (DUF1610 family)